MTVLTMLTLRLLLFVAIGIESCTMGLDPERAVGLCAILLPGTVLELASRSRGLPGTRRAWPLIAVLQCISLIFILAYAHEAISGVNFFAMVSFVVGVAEAGNLLLLSGKWESSGEYAARTRVSGNDGDIGRAVSGLEALCLLIEGTLNAHELRRVLRFLDEGKRLDEEVQIDSLSFSAAVFQTGMLLERRHLVLAFLARLRLERPNAGARIERLQRSYEVRGSAGL
jgi:hypothetical protein